jgi:hypothetical protein
VTVTRKSRLVPTGDCFCGCGEEAEIGRWFVQGHDITAAAALRAVEGGLSLPQRLVEAGFGPERSVVEEAVAKAGWARCAGCAYAGTPAGLAAHMRGGGCAAEPDGLEEPAGREIEPAEPAARSGRTGPATAGSAPPVRAETGAAQGVLLPGTDDPAWGEMPLTWRRSLRMPAHQLVTPLQGPLAKPDGRRLRGAVRAAARMRMTGAHWHLLLMARREDFGSPRSRRADAVFEVLQRLVAEHLAPAAEEGPPGPGDTEPAG